MPDNTLPYGNPQPDPPVDGRRLIGAAVIVVAGAILVGAGVIAQAIQPNGAGGPVATVGSVLVVVALVVFCLGYGSLTSGKH
jgi:uncharacterized protein involved in response to NO